MAPPPGSSFGLPPPDNKGFQWDQSKTTTNNFDQFNNNFSNQTSNTSSQGGSGFDFPSSIQTTQSLNQNNLDLLGDFSMQSNKPSTNQGNTNNQQQNNLYDLI